MSVTISVPATFSAFLDNNNSVSVKGATVGECLEDLSRKYPKTEGMFMDNDGNLVERFEILVNGRNIYPAGKEAKLADGDRIDLVFIIHGG